MEIGSIENDELEDYIPGREANYTTPHDAMMAMFGRKLDPILEAKNQAEIKKFQDEQIADKNDYTALLKDKRFQKFLEKTVGKIAAESVLNPLYVKGEAKNPALAHMTATELALIFQGMQLAVRTIYADLDEKTRTLPSSN